MNSRRSRGLSVAELLVVTAILSVLVAIAVPSLSGFVDSHERTRALSEIADLVELARNEAMTRQCYTWLGFETSVDAEKGDVLGAVVMAPEGGVIGTSGSAGAVLIANARPLTRMFRWKDLRLETLERLERIKDLASAGEASEPLESQPVQEFRLGGDGETLDLKVITFTPQGYALLTPRPTLMTPYVRFIDVGLLPTREGRDIDSPDQLAVVLNGFNGHADLLRR